MITKDRLNKLLTVGGANSAPMHEISEMAEELIANRKYMGDMQSRLHKLLDEFVTSYVRDRITKHFPEVLK